MISTFLIIYNKDEKSNFKNNAVKKINNINLISTKKQHKKYTNVAVQIVKYLPIYLPLQPFLFFI